MRLRKTVEHKIMRQASIVPCNCETIQQNQDMAGLFLCCLRCKRSSTKGKTPNQDHTVHAIAYDPIKVELSAIPPALPSFSEQIDRRSLKRSETPASITSASAPSFSLAPQHHDRPSSESSLSSVQTITQLNSSKSPNGSLANASTSGLASDSRRSTNLWEDPLSKPFRRAQTSHTVSSTESRRLDRTVSEPTGSNPIRVQINTKFAGRLHFSEFDLPRNLSTKEHYQIIESSSKQHCKGDLEADKELSLFSGQCRIIPRNGKEEPMNLENSEDWGKIRTILDNFAETRQEYSVIIERTIAVTTKPTTMHELGPKLSGTWRAHVILELRRAVRHCKKQKFYPRDVLEILSSHLMISAIVETETWLEEDERKQFAKDIHSRAPSLFVLLVGKRIELPELRTALHREPKDVILDDILRQETIDLSWIVDEVKRALWEEALDSRWSFSAAQFFIPGDYQVFNPNTILPWMKMEECGQGAYSTVYAVDVLASHQHLVPNTPGENPRLALKILDRGQKRRGDSSNPELKNLNLLNKLKHDHIIRLLSSYTKDENLHFLFPLAVCNLDEYMRRNDAQFGKRFVIWIIGQFVGLADGIQAIHRKTDVRENFRPELEAPSDDRTGKQLGVRKAPSASTGYHHDLKASNILYFGKGQDSKAPDVTFGLFQIIDFGVSKFHVLSDDERTKGTEHPRGTTTYQGPESRIKKWDESKKKYKLDVSRPYDVWGFGCIMIEILVWLLLGRAARHSFGDKRMGFAEEGSEVEETDAFWIASRNFLTAKVRPTVTEMLETLRRSQRTRLVPSLLRWINLAEKMLEVNPKERISIVAVEDELKKILGEVQKIEDFDSSRPVTPTAEPGIPDLTVSEPGNSSARGSPSKGNPRSAMKSGSFRAQKPPVQFNGSTTITALGPPIKEEPHTPV